MLTCSSSLAWGAAAAPHAANSALSAIEANWSTNLKELG